MILINWNVFKSSTEIFEICLFSVRNSSFSSQLYKYHFNLLDLPILAQHRRLLNIKFIRGLITNQVDSSCFLSQINFKVPSYETRSQKTFHIPNAITNHLQNEPLRRMMSFASEDLSFDNN